MKDNYTLICINCKVFCIFSELNQFLKIPFFSTSKPCSIQLQKAYASYLWLKNKYQATGGVLPHTFSGDDRNHNNYWRVKLEKLGWIVFEGGEYRLKNYQSVWEMMGIEKVNLYRNQSKRVGLGYKKLDVGLEPMPLKNFKAFVLKSIREYLATAKKNQITFRLLSGSHASKHQQKKQSKLIRRTHEPEFSSKASAKLFGYKTSSDGHGRGYELLHEFFKVTNKPKLIKYLNHKNLPFFRAEASRISLV